MRSPSIVVLVFLVFAASARAQAPTEERRPQGNALVDAQQRTEFARQASTAANSRTAVAEQALKEADAEVKAVQKQMDAARGRQDKARKDLADARAAAAAAKKDFERQSAELERTRRGQK